MSRVGNNPISIPEGVSIEVNKDKPRRIIHKPNSSATLLFKKFLVFVKKSAIFIKMNQSNWFVPFNYYW